MAVSRRAIFGFVVSAPAAAFGVGATAVDERDVLADVKAAAIAGARAALIDDFRRGRLRDMTA